MSYPGQPAHGAAGTWTGDADVDAAEALRDAERRLQRAQLASDAGEPFLARVRYTRTWIHDDNSGWRLIAAHVSPVPEDTAASG